MNMFMTCCNVCILCVQFDSMNGGLDHDLGDGDSELSRSSVPTSSNYGGRGGLPRVVTCICDLCREICVKIHTQS